MASVDALRTHIESNGGDYVVFETTCKEDTANHCAIKTFDTKVVGEGAAA